MMSARSFLLLVLGVSLLMSWPFQTAYAKSHYPEGTMSAAEVKALFTGKTTEISFGKSDKGLRYFSPNGQFRQVRNDRLRKGEWKVRSNGRLCTRFGDAKWKCRLLVPDGEKIRQYIPKKDGKHKRELTYLKFHEGRKIKELNRAPLLPAGTLTKKQLSKLFAGKTVESVTAKKGRVSLSYYDSAGTIEQLRNGQVRTGKWWVRKDDRICLQMQDLKEKCRIVVKEGDSYKKYIVKKNGKHQHSVTYRSFMSGKQF